MYFSSLTVVKWDENFKNMYIRIVSKHGIKSDRRAMKALIAVQRKLLELAFTLFKTKAKYDKLFEARKAEQKNSMSAQNA